MSETEVVVNPLVPDEARPEACRTAGCAFDIVRGSLPFDVRNRNTVFLHTVPGREPDEILIPSEWLADIHRDIWGDHLLPWLKGLHEEAA